MAACDSSPRPQEDGSHVETLAHGATCVDVELGKSESTFRGGGTFEDPFVVDWIPGDPESPYNWSRRRKWLITVQVCRHALLLSCKVVN